ncbi:hypothetical protein B0H14DRAFT_2576434 [Mycena olivaceomarginata]|nr:hypothetical protein B0H14DRAFT_2576434 [Mycena olivaceomarginata]
MPPLVFPTILLLTISLNALLIFCWVIHGQGSSLQAFKSSNYCKSNALKLPSTPSMQLKLRITDTSSFKMSPKPSSHLNDFLKLKICTTSKLRLLACTTSGSWAEASEEHLGCIMPKCAMLWIVVWQE